MKYEIRNVSLTDKENNWVVKTDENGREWWIPMDETNSDYQAYLAYVANGNKLPSESSIPTTPQAGA